MVNHHPIQLFGHMPIKRAPAGLKMNDRDTQLCRAQPACQCCIGVALNEYHIGLLAQEDWLEPGKHTRCLFAMGSRADRKRMVGWRQAKLLKEQRIHLEGVVLPRVDEHMPEPLAQERNERRELDNLRACAHHGQDGLGNCAMPSAAVVAARLDAARARRPESAGAGE
jgi:hypothetical protein